VWKAQYILQIAEISKVVYCDQPSTRTLKKIICFI